MREAVAERAQLGDAAQRAADEEAMHHGIEPARELRIVRDEFVRHRAAETVAPALRIKTQQMIAIGTGAVDPQFADHAVDQGLVHRASVCWPPPRQMPSVSEGQSESRLAAYVAMQYEI